MSRGIEALCLELDKIRTSGSAIISTFRHQCDSGRVKKTEKNENYFKPLELPTESKIQEGSVERGDFSRSTLPIPKLSFINKPTLTKNINQDILSSEKISSPRNLSLSPQTTQVLENIETLVKNAQKQLTEINDNILFYKKNPEMPEAQPTIDEDLLRLRQIVAFKFQEANNSPKVRSIYDHTKFTDSIQQVPEEKITKVPRLLKLMTMLPEKCSFNVRDNECCKQTSNWSRRKILSPHSQLPQTCDKIKTQSLGHQEKAAQTDEKENKPESSTFQIQNGPKVIIKRSLQVQNVNHFHVSPETSFQEPNNVGIYNFQHKTPLEQKNFCEDQFISEDDPSEVLKGGNSGRRQIFRKSVVLKKPDDSRRRTSLKKDTEKILGKITVANKNFNEINIEGSCENIIDDEFISQSPKEFTVNSTKSPKQCNIENPKTKAYLEYLSNLERDSDKKMEELEQVTKERKIQSCEKEDLPKKPTIISNERVNFEYKDILRGAQINSSIPKSSFVKFDQFSNESNLEFDHINLKKPCVFDLDTILKRNSEIIENVIQNTDMLLKTMSSKFETHNKVMNQDGIEKVNRNVLMASLQNLQSPEKKLESIKSTLVDNFPKKYFPKENEFKSCDEKILDRIISSPNKVSKFEINDSAVNHENLINNQSVNLSSEIINLMSSTKSLILQPSLPSTITKSLSAASKDGTLNDLKDLSIEIFSEERETQSGFQWEKNSKCPSEENKEENNEIHYEGKENAEFPQNLKESSNMKGSESNIEKVSPAKLSFNSNHSNKIENTNYSRNSVKLKENNYSEMEIFSRIFESLKISSAAMKKFITCLFGETEARIENEIIRILREIGVNATIINQFLIILQNRDKNSKLLMFIKDLGSYLNLRDDENDIESRALRKQFKDFLDKSKTNLFDSETDKNFNPTVASKIESKDNNKSLQTKLDFDVTAKDKKVICDDSKLVAAQEKVDFIKPQEKVNFVDNLDQDFSWKKSTNVEEMFVDKSNYDEIYELKKEANNNSLELKLQTGKLNFREVKSNSPAKIKSIINSESSVTELSKGIDYSQNFTDYSSTSKHCKSLESHVSLKLSDSFTYKREDPNSKEISAQRNDELEIHQKIDNLLDMEKRVAQSIEESIKTEINNLTKESTSQESLKRKSLIRGETFIIKKSNLDHKEKSIKADCSVFNNSLNDSEREFKLKTPSVNSEGSKKINKSSPENYSLSEGEIYWPSSQSYSLGEIRVFPRENSKLKRIAYNKCSTTTLINQKQNSSNSSSETHSPGELYE